MLSYLLLYVFGMSVFIKGIEAFFETGDALNIEAEHIDNELVK